MIGYLRTVVLDCPDPRSLAPFYVQLLGAEVVIDKDDWVAIVASNGTRLAFQRAPEYKPPHFPDPEASQQVHFDIRVDDIEVAEPQALALGAKLVVKDDEDWFRVYADPVGHIFCLEWVEG